MSDEELTSVRRRIKSAARRMAMKLSVDDVDAMAEDLEMAGWCGWMSHPEKPPPLRFIDAKREMMNEWLYWRFEMGRKAVKLAGRVELNRVELPIGLSSGDDVESNAMTQELLTKLSEQMQMNTLVGRRSGWRNPQQTNGRRTAVLSQLLLDDGEFYHHGGIPKSSFHRHRMVIQETLSSLLEGRVN